MMKTPKITMSILKLWSPFSALPWQASGEPSSGSPCRAEEVSLHWCSSRANGLRNEVDPTPIKTYPHNGLFPA